MTSTGHGAPAITPVRKLRRSKPSNAGSSSIAMNIVGTPYTLVQRSASIASRHECASNDSAGRTTVAPWARHARLPSTIPKQ